MPTYSEKWVGKAITCALSRHCIGNLVWDMHHARGVTWGLCSKVAYGNMECFGEPVCHLKTWMPTKAPNMRAGTAREIKIRCKALLIAPVSRQSVDRLPLVTVAKAN